MTQDIRKAAELLLKEIPAGTVMDTEWLRETVCKHLEAAQLLARHVLSQPSASIEVVDSRAKGYLVSASQPDGGLREKAKDEYYLRDTRSITGNCVMFWRKGKGGYTYNLDDLEIFTKEKAFAQNRMRETDVPYLKSFIDSLSERHLDVQDLNRAEQLASHPVKEG